MPKDSHVEDILIVIRPTQKFQRELGINVGVYIRQHPSQWFYVFVFSNTPFVTFFIFLWQLWLSWLSRFMFTATEYSHPVKGLWPKPERGGLI